MSISYPTADSVAPRRICPDIGDGSSAPLYHAAAEGGTLGTRGFGIFSGGKRIHKQLIFMCVCVCDLFHIR